MRYLGLAVDSDVAADQSGEIDVLDIAVETQIDAVMDQALGMHPRAQPQLVEKIGGALLQHAGAIGLKPLVGYRSVESVVVASALLQNYPLLKIDAKDLLVVFR